MLGEPGQGCRGAPRIAVPFCFVQFCPDCDARLLLMRVDLNADVGESFGPYSIGHDRGLMQVITSANIAACEPAGRRGGLWHCC